MRGAGPRTDLIDAEQVPQKVGDHRERIVRARGRRFLRLQRSKRHYVNEREASTAILTSLWALDARDRGTKRFGVS